VIFPDPCNVGDEVAITNRHGKVTRCTIQRVTATQITVANAKFTRSRGFEVGVDPWSSPSARPWTPEIEAQIAAKTDRLARAERRDAAIDRIRALVGNLASVRNSPRDFTTAHLDALETLVASVEGRVVAFLAAVDAEVKP
jgi:anti-sigma factor ChrR (cupin superfamily)